MVDASARQYWDSLAPTFDSWPDHGLAEPVMRRAWLDLLIDVLPEPPAVVADLGCGTGSLAVLLAESGYTVSGLDLAPAMIERAGDKADRHNVDVRFAVGDAAAPPYDPASLDVVLARHVVWALPDPAAAMRRWVELLRPNGTLVLVEGVWFTGGGISADMLRALTRPHFSAVEVRQLVDPVLWGGAVDDERYLLRANR